MHGEGKHKIYGQPESTSWFNSTIFSVVYNNYKETNAVLCSLSHWYFPFFRAKEKTVFTVFLFLVFLTDLGIMTASFLISRKPTALG